MKGFKETGWGEIREQAVFKSLGLVNIHGYRALTMERVARESGLELEELNAVFDGPAHIMAYILTIVQEELFNSLPSYLDTSRLIEQQASREDILRSGLLLRLNKDREYIMSLFTILDAERDCGDREREQQAKRILEGAESVLSFIIARIMSSGLLPYEEPHFAARLWLDLCVKRLSNHGFLEPDSIGMFLKGEIPPWT